MRNKQKETFFDYPVFDNVKQVIYYSIEKYANNIAFKIKEKQENEVKYIDITYKKFLEEVNNLGTGLFSLGLENKKIALLSKNRYEWALSYVSILLGGMIAVPLENSLLRGNVDAIIYEEKYSDIIEKVKKERKIKHKRIYMHGQKRKCKVLKRHIAKGKREA